MLGNTAEEMGFNRNFMFSDLIVYNSKLPHRRPERRGSGVVGHRSGARTATPMHMALIAATIANRGVMERAAPRRADHDRAGRKPRAAQPRGRQARARRGRGGAAGKKR